MEQPSVSNPIRDEKNGITYNVVAYRKLSREEIVLAIKHYRASKKTKKSKKGTTVTIVTIIGYND
jgi:hypothetical protein